jgi:hypothetical protein
MMNTPIFSMNTLPYQSGGWIGTLPSCIVVRNGRKKYILYCMEGINTRPIARVHGREYISIKVMNIERVISIIHDNKRRSP